MMLSSFPQQQEPEPEQQQALPASVLGSVPQQQSADLVSSFFLPKLKNAILTPPLNNEILNCVEEITDDDNTGGTDGHKDTKQFWLDGLAEHDHRRQAQSSNSHHEG